MSVDLSPSVQKQRKQGLTKNACQHAGYAAMEVNQDGYIVSNEKGALPTGKTWDEPGVTVTKSGEGALVATSGTGDDAPDSRRQ